MLVLSAANEVSHAWVQVLDFGVRHVVLGTVQSCSPAHYGEVAYMLQKAFNLTVEVSIWL